MEHVQTVQGVESINCYIIDMEESPRAADVQAEHTTASKVGLQLINLRYACV